MTTGNTNFPEGPYDVGKHILPPPRPSSPETAEFRLNHLMLRIKDPKKSLEFYCDCMGLHLVFVFNTGPWTIYYLGPRDVDISCLGTSKGLLELYHLPADAAINYSSGNDYSRMGVGFGHVGFTVPDVATALERVQKFGFEILKSLEGDAEGQMGLNPDIVQGKHGEVAEGYKHIFRQLAFVRDPDGYWVELVPQTVKPPGSH